MSKEKRNIRVMIVDDIPDTCDQLAKLLAFEQDMEVVAIASNGYAAIRMAKESPPDVILMDINMPNMDGITATQIIVAENPTIQIIMISIQKDHDYFRRAMLAGAREFLVKPVNSEELYHTIRQVVGEPTPSPEVPDPSNTTNATAPRNSTIIAVYSPKGGTGTSVIAANISIALREITQKRVALVDGNLTHGDQHILLNLDCMHTMLDLVHHTAALDSDILFRVLTTHPSQLKVLLTSPDPHANAHITPEQLEHILEHMRTQFDYIVIDVPATLEDHALAMLDMADTIALLMTLELTCIKDVKLFLDLANLLNYPVEKLLLILNHADQPTNLRRSSIEPLLQKKITARITSAQQDMIHAVNRGIPLVIDQREHHFSRDILALAHKITNNHAPIAPATPNFLQRLVSFLF